MTKDVQKSLSEHLKSMNVFISGIYEIPEKMEEDGSIVYRISKGRKHRLNGPAVIEVDGTEKWYYKGHLHRVEGPAVTKADGTQEWYLEGRLQKRIEPNGWVSHFNAKGKLHNPVGYATYNEKEDIYEVRINGHLFMEYYYDPQNNKMVKKWYNKSGELHRRLPNAAVEYEDGREEFFEHGIRRPVPSSANRQKKVEDTHYETVKGRIKERALKKAEALQET